MEGGKVMIAQKVEKNKIVLKYGRKIKNSIREHKKKKAIKGKHQFINRQHGYKKMCMILAGYKPLVWEDVKARILNYIPKDIDVCLLSSGKYCDYLADDAKKYNWSYLSTSDNKVTLIQNIAISLFPKAELIYKLDEDIFVTKDFFRCLEDTYRDVERNSYYDVGFV